MPVQYWESLLNAGAPWQSSSGTADSGTAATIITPVTPADFTLPANWWYQGCIVRVTARGVVTVGSTATNLTLALAQGVAGTLGTTLATTGAVALTTSITNLQWKLQAYIQCRAIGTSGNTLFTQGEADMPTAATTFARWPLPASAGPTAAAVNTQNAGALGIVATLSQTTGAPSIQCTYWCLEAMD